MQVELCQIFGTEIDPGMARVPTQTTSVFNRTMLPAALLYNIEKHFPRLQRSILIKVCILARFNELIYQVFLKSQS